jgi:hypothetical protein
MFKAKALLRLHFIIALLFVFASSSKAALNDIYPGDYLPANAGQNAFLLYLYDRNLDGTYTAGNSSGRYDRDSRMAIVLGAHYFDFQGFRMAVSGSVGRALQSTTDLSTSQTADVNGTTDPKFSLTVWPYMNNETRHYFAVNLAQIVPWGSYDNTQSQNIGQNRERTALSLAWAKQTTERTLTEITAEFDRFGVNDRYGASASRLEQRWAQSLTGFVRYQATGSLSPYLGAQLNYGGESILNGTPMGDTLRSSRAYLGLRYQPEPANIFHLRFAKDIDVVSGYRLGQEIVFRWTWLPK